VESVAAFEPSVMSGARAISRRRLFQLLAGVVVCVSAGSLSAFAAEARVLPGGLQRLLVIGRNAASQCFPERLRWARVF